MVVVYLRKIRPTQLWVELSWVVAIEQMVTVDVDYEPDGSTKFINISSCRECLHYQCHPPQLVQGWQQLPQQQLLQPQLKCLPKMNL